MATDVRGCLAYGGAFAAYKTTEQGVEHPFRDSIVTNLVKLVDVMPRLNVTHDPELKRLTDQVRASLLVDPPELPNPRAFARTPR